MIVPCTLDDLEALRKISIATFVETFSGDEKQKDYRMTLTLTDIKNP